MNQATITLRVEPGLKQKFDMLCEAFGLSTAAAFNIFMRTVVRERRIPFEIKVDNHEIVREKAFNAFKAMQQSIAQRGIPEMGLDEINAEIKASRNERKAKNLCGN